MCPRATNSLEPDGGGSAALADAAGGLLDPPPAAAISLSMSSSDALISKFTCACSTSGTLSVPLISEAFARSATNCASSFPPASRNWPERNAIGALQPPSASVTPESFESACQSCTFIGLITKLCIVTLIPLASADISGLPRTTLSSSTSASVSRTESISSSDTPDDASSFFEEAPPFFPFGGVFCAGVDDVK